MQSDAQARYLDSASNILQSSSPSISAHLQLARNDLAQDGGHHGQERSCSACGNIFVPGWSCKKVSKSSRKHSRKDRTQKDDTDTRCVHLRCLRCDAITAIERPKRESIPVRAEIPKVPGHASKDRRDKREIAPQTGPIESSSGEGAAQPPRKRARGKKSTLQSMLSEQQAAKPPVETGLGLGLMDFMKT